MAYPADTAVETAIGTIESVLIEDLQRIGNREAVGKWREVLRYIEGAGATGYDALTQRTWADDDLFNGPND